jgi:hypothetical protein
MKLESLLAMLSALLAMLSLRLRKLLRRPQKLDVNYQLGSDTSKTKQTTLSLSVETEKED